MLETEDIHVRFGHVHALRGVTLGTSGTEVLAVIGPNGAGKSTLMNTIAGLYKPAYGHVRMNGNDLTGRPARTVVAAGVTLVPQGRRLFGSMSVRENLELGAFTKNNRKETDQRIGRLADLFPEIGARMSIRGSQLSGGQQQIVAIMRGLMSEPRILILDEPSIGLAPMIVQRIGHEIRRLNRETGIGVILVEQNVDFALGVADRVAILAQGRVVHIGPPDALRDPNLLAHYFFGQAGAATAPV